VCNLVKGVEFWCHNTGIHGSLRHLYLLGWDFESECLTSVVVTVMDLNLGCRA